MPASPQPDRFLIRWIALCTILILALLPVVYRLLWRDTATPEGGPAGDDVVVIEYMAWGNPQQLETERTIIRRFNKRCLDTGQPLRVDLFVTPADGYVQKLLTMLAGDVAPDVVRVDHFQFPSIAGRGFLHDLTDMARSDPTFHPQDFDPAAMRENYYNNHFYGLNMLFGGVICYYNKDLFRQRCRRQAFHPRRRRPTDVLRIDSSRRHHRVSRRSTRRLLEFLALAARRPMPQRRLHALPSRFTRFGAGNHRHAIAGVRPASLSDSRRGG
jgi:hypothetical protein